VFNLEKNKIFYYNDPKDPAPVGSLNLDLLDSVTSSQFGGKPNCFEVKLKGVSYYMYAETESVSIPTVCSFNSDVESSGKSGMDFIIGILDHLFGFKCTDAIREAG
jgi:hypothetical protein